MIAPFDIFRIEIDGAPIWRCTAETLEEAKQRVRELAADSPGKYSVVSVQTKHRLDIVADGQPSDKAEGLQRKNTRQRPAIS
jgi:hypothetical protein